MTDTQLYPATGVPILSHAAMLTLAVLTSAISMDSRVSKLKGE
jgi:hypothetical protein